MISCYAHQQNHVSWGVESCLLKALNRASPLMSQTASSCNVFLQWEHIEKHIGSNVSSPQECLSATPWFDAPTCPAEWLRGLVKLFRCDISKWLSKAAQKDYLERPLFDSSIRVSRRCPCASLQRVHSTPPDATDNDFRRLVETSCQWSPLWLPNEVQGSPFGGFKFDHQSKGPPSGCQMSCKGPPFGGLNFDYQSKGPPFGWNVKNVMFSTLLQIRPFTFA